MSLAALNFASAANQGVVMPVLHPVDRVPIKNGETAITITLLGKDSDAFVAAERAARNRQVENLKDRVKYSAAEDDRQAAETLAGCIVTWDGIPTCWVEGGEDETPIAFSREAAVKMMLNPGVSWLFTAIDKYVGDRSHFLKG